MLDYYITGPYQYSYTTMTTTVIIIDFFKILLKTMQSDFEPTEYTNNSTKAWRTRLVRLQCCTK